MSSSRSLVPRPASLDRVLTFVRKREGRAARLSDVSTDTIRSWMDHMADTDLALSTMRSRQSTLSSFCAWLVKRETIPENPIVKLDRPRYKRVAPRQVPSVELMDALVDAAKQRKRPRDIAIFLILRYTGMRRESVASLRVRHLDAGWGLRGVYTKGSKTRDIPLPSVVMAFLQAYVERVLMHEVGKITGDTPLFWSRWPGRNGVRRVMPIHASHLAALQDVRTADRRARAQAPRPPPRRRHGGPRAASRSGTGACVARSHAHRHDADVREHSSRPAQARSRSTRTRLRAC